MMKRYAAWIGLVVISFLVLQAALAATPSVKGFEKLKQLVGDWEGKDNHGAPVTTSFKLVAGNTAVEETLKMSEMDEMVTMYSVDGDSIVLLHFCPTNNQPRMRAVPGPGDINELVFIYQGAGNLPSVDVGHEHRLVMQFDDNNHLTETWTWRKNGNDTPMVYHFTRKGH